MGDRQWKVVELKGLLDEFCATGFGASTERVALRAELEREIEVLVKQVYAAVDENQRRKYYCARFAYLHRKEMTPGVRKDGKGRPIGSVSWPVWFQQTFNDDLERYMRECKERDTLKTVHDYELAQFGSSALEDDMKRREQRRAVA